MAQIAQDIKKICPNAVLLNYTPFRAVLDGIAQAELLGDADRRLDVVQTVAVDPERHRPV